MARPARRDRRRHQDGHVERQLGKIPDRAGDERRPAGHRLQRGQAEPLVGRRQDDHGGLPVQRGEVGVLHRPAEHERHVPPPRLGGEAVGLGPDGAGERQRRATLAELAPSPRAACRGPCAGPASAGSPPRARTASSSPSASAMRASRSFGRAENTGPTPCGTTCTRAGSRSSASIASTRVVSLTAMIPAHARMAGASSVPYSRRAAPDGPGAAAARHISTSCTVTTWRAIGKPRTGSPPRPWTRCGCRAMASESTCGWARRNRAGRASLHGDEAGTDGMISRSGTPCSASINWLAYRPIPASRRPSPRQLASSSTRRGLCIEAL